MRAFFAALFLLFSFTSAIAAGLNDDSVSRWIDALEDVKACGEAHQHVFDVDTKINANPMTPGLQPLTEDELQSMRQPFSRAVEAVEQAGLAGELEGVVGPYGFSLAGWGETGDLVFRAYMALQMSKQNTDPAQMRAMIAQLESNPQIPAAQKKNLLDSLRSVQRMMDIMSEAPEADQAVVKRHQKELEKAFR